MFSRAVCFIVFIGSLPNIALSQSQGILADYVVTEQKHLVDGNRIEHSVVGEFAQDDAGRTYLRFDDWVVISDPMARIAWQVDVPAGVAFQHQGESSVESIEFGNVDLSDPSLQINIPTPSEQAPIATDLGMRIRDGIRSNGTRWIQTIPTSALGNENPIQFEGEMWVSEDFGFKVVVETITRDPLSGIHKVELRNIAMANFDSDYFRPNEKYTIENVR